MVFVCFLKNSQFHAFKCVRSKSQILRVKNVKNQNLTHPKAAKLATLQLLQKSQIEIKMYSTRIVQKCSGIRVEIFADLFDINTREYIYRMY